MKIKTTLIFLFLAAIISCNRIIEIDIPEEDPQLVVNSLLNPDSTIKINLTKSLYVFDKSTFFRK